MLVICVLFLIVVPLPPAKTPSAVKINNNNNKISTDPRQYSRSGRGPQRDHWPYIFLSIILCIFK
jgi:hypothetical protein